MPTTVLTDALQGRIASQIFSFAAEVTGRIREMHFSFESVISSGGYLTVRRAGSFILNGTNQSIPTSFFRAVNGTDIVLSKTGLDIPVTRGDLVEVLTVTSQGTFRALSPNAEFLMVVEEGV